MASVWTSAPPCSTYTTGHSRESTASIICRLIAAADSLAEGRSRRRRFDPACEVDHGVRPKGAYAPNVLRPPQVYPMGRDVIEVNRAAVKQRMNLMMTRCYGAEMRPHKARPTCDHQPHTRLQRLRASIRPTGPVPRAHERPPRLQC